MKPERSLKSRALQLLSQRDQSRLELRRKLLRHAKQAEGQDGEARDGEARDGEAQDGESAAAKVDEVLAWLEANAFLSDTRFAESRIHARAARFGNLRIHGELKQHGVTVATGAAEVLAASEPERASAVRERRFGAPPESAAERAAQSRFLAARGFSPEVIHRLMRQLSRAESEA